MYLYEQEYGYTFLRLMVYVSLITEAILIIPTVLYILDFKINLTKTYFVVIIVMYIIVNYINIDNIIAKRNIDRYFEDQTGTYELDMNYLETLSIDAVGQVERLKGTNDEFLEFQVRVFLDNAKTEVENITWQNFNINRAIAKSELAQ